ncbi:MAG: hypothetical protein RBJ76_27250 [Stenomitos frigidus ULC029]
MHTVHHHFDHDRHSTENTHIPAPNDHYGSYGTNAPRQCRGLKASRTHCVIASKGCASSSLDDGASGLFAAIGGTTGTPNCIAAA